MLLIAEAAQLSKEEMLIFWARAVNPDMPWPEFAQLPIYGQNGEYPLAPDTVRKRVTRIMERCRKTRPLIANELQDLLL